MGCQYAVSLYYAVASLTDIILESRKIHDYNEANIDWLYYDNSSITITRVLLT